VVDQINKKSVLKLGLIGDNIAASRAPDLHRIAGETVGRTVTYDRLVPKDMGIGFDAVFSYCVEHDYHGINVTYPYKERAVSKVIVPDPLVKAMGAVNTILFDGENPSGHNTDYSGFIAAFRNRFDDMSPGSVTLVGAGGAGRAVAFGLVALGVNRICIIDKELKKAHALERDLRQVAPDLDLTIGDDVARAVSAAEGIVNCTPIGMVGYEGTPIPATALGSQKWVFDAVYTPIETQFLRDAAAAEIPRLSGYELFFFQGVQAFKLFSGADVVQEELRLQLSRG